MGYLREELATCMQPVKYRHEYRRTDRSIFESRELASLLYSRIEGIVKRIVVCVTEDARLQHTEGDTIAEDDACPSELRVGYGSEGVWRPIGLNEQLRFERYEAGGYFREHCDSCYQRSEDERSLMTCMFHLEGDLDGGREKFLDIERDVPYEEQVQPAPADAVVATVEPEPGMCLLFFQPGFLHQGEELKSGTKHVVRTDVMFRVEAGTRPKRTPEQIEGYALFRKALKADQEDDIEHSRPPGQRATVRLARL